MSERRIGQLSFADQLTADAAGTNEFLARLSELLDWSEVEGLLSGLHGGRMGAPAYPALALSGRFCCSSGTAFPIRSWRKRWPTACRFGVSAGFR